MLHLIKYLEHQYEKTIESQLEKKQKILESIFDNYYFCKTTNTLLKILLISCNLSFVKVPSFK